MYAAGPPMPPPPRRSVWIWLGPLLGVLGILAMLLAFSMMRFCTRVADAGGVRAANDISASALASIEKRKLLLPGEKLVSFYDVTVSGDASELAMVTTQRLVYVNGDRVNAFPLGEITDVRHRSESLAGDIIEAQNDAGEIIKIEIAPLNGGASFLAALEAGRSNARKPK